ncbi:MAG TPA: cupin domain-containing protein [Chthoniobacterales bacterium]|nr:cupin domain-containing protein [Chthoniobacterales bacterium]
MKIIATEINHQDHRGSIMDLIERANINAVTFISFKKGAVRGNHYHKQTTQWNYVLKGKIKLIAQVGNGAPEEAVLEAGGFAVTEPMEKHALVGVEDSEMLVFTQGPRGGKEYESDTFRLDIPLAQG